jgi:hypothetical protein
MSEERNSIPYAQIDNKVRPCLVNPQILTWTYTGNGKMEGRGLVRVEQDNPIRSLHPDAFAVQITWGEVRLALAWVNGIYGPLIIERPQPGEISFSECL